MSLEELFGLVAGNKFNSVRIKVVTAGSMKMAVFWDVASVVW
jgi:hypothetical protein